MIDSGLTVYDDVLIIRHVFSGDYAGCWLDIVAKDREKAQD